MSHDEIRLDRQDGIALLTLYRPERMNAFTGQMMEEIIAALDECDADDGVRAVIFTGEGEKAFCAGADLGAGAATFDYDKLDGKADSPVAADGTIDWSHPLVRDGGGRVSMRIFEAKKPIIGAINGAAVGIGATMTLPMDMRVASTTARFGFVFARRGIVPEAASSWFLPRLVGIQQALEWCYTGRIFDAAEAKAGGLVRSVHAASDLLPAAQSIAREIADNTSAVSVAMTRAMMWRLMSADHPMEAHKIDSRAIYRLSRGADAKEGIASFLEKRAPAYPGRVSADMPDFYPWWDARPYE